MELMCNEAYKEIAAKGNPMAVFPTIEIEVKSVFGKTTIYPANEAAELLAKIAGTVTLTDKALALAEQMGFTVKEVLKPQTRFAA